MDSETNARKRPSENLPEDSPYNWQEVQDKRKRKKNKETTQTMTVTVTDPSTGAITKNLPKRPIDKFKVIAVNSTEGYRTMSAFLEKNKGLKLSMKPNIRGGMDRDSSRC